MSDVGLGANLELSISDALRRVDQLGAALDQISHVEVQADTSRVSPAIEAAIAAARGDVQVDTDARAVTAQIDGAIDAADTGILITGDAGPVTSEIDGAVDNADTAVLITGDASPVTSAIDGAVADAQAEAHVDVDGSVSPGLQTDVLNLGANIADASDEASGLSRVLAGLSVGAAAAGLFALADAASEAEQSVGGVEAVFGNASDVITTFASESAASAGLAATSARNLTAQIGGLLKGFNFTQREAAETSVVIAQLGADLAATFGGKPEEAVEALGGALRGEFNPLERFGVSLNIAQINAYAVAKGLAASTSQVDLATRAQATLQLIMERTADAQGQFARESDTAAGAISIARAEAQNLAAEAGQNLTPALLALVGVVSRDVLPKLAEAGDDVLPAVSDALVNLAPLLGTTTDLLVAAAPVIELVAEGLAAIPPEAVAIAGSLVLANKAIGILGQTVKGIPGAIASLPGILSGVSSAVPRATSGVGALAGGVQGLATSIASLNPVTVGATLIAAGLFTVWQDSKEEAKRFSKEVDELNSSLERVDGRVVISTSGISKYVESLSQLADQDQIDKLGKIGITIDQISQFAQRGPQGLRLFTDALVNAGDATRVYRNEFGEIVDEQGKVIDSNSKLGQSLEDVGGQLIVGNTDAIQSYEDLTAVVEENARRQVALLQAQGLVTDEQVRTALATNDSGEATRTYTEALLDLQPAVAGATKAQQDAKAKYDEIASTYLNTAEAARTLGKEAPAVNQAIADIASGRVAGDRGFLNFALTIDKATLSEQGFSAAAAIMGTDVESLKGFIDSTTGAIDDFVTTATNGLPTVASVLAETQTAAQNAAQAQGESIVAAAQDRADRIREDAAKRITDAGDKLSAAQAEQIRSNAEKNATAIVDAAKVSADAVSESGHVTAAAFAKQLTDSAKDMADFRSDLDKIAKAGFTDVAGLLAQQGQDLGGELADELSNALASGNTALLEQLSEANKTFTSETQKTVDYMRDVLGPELILQSGLVGQGAADALFKNLDFGERIRIQGELAKTELSEQGQVIAVVAATQGEAIARQFGANLQLDQETIEAGVAAGAAIKAHAPTKEAGEAGRAVGTAFGQGMVDGLAPGGSFDVAIAARALVAQAEQAARDAAEAKSPSRLFARVGADMGAGVAVGLDESSRSVVAAAEQIVRDAAGAVARVSPEVIAQATTGPVNPGGGLGSIPDALIEALEALVRQGPAVQFGPFTGDVRTALREAVTEGRAIARGGL